MYTVQYMYTLFIRGATVVVSWFAGIYYILFAFIGTCRLANVGVSSMKQDNSNR